MADLPTGTVTFLFTDIEGSTAMWERDEAAMRAALARHDEIMHGAVAEHGGCVFKTIGDAFCAAFATAPDAVEAALAAQRALFSEEWTQTGAVRVRMALHTGAAEERGGDYFGPPLNRVARLLSAGHGVVMWSSGFIGAKLGTQEASTPTFVAWKFLFAASLLLGGDLAVMCGTHGPTKPDGKSREP